MSAIDKHWLKGQPFARSIPRRMDRGTLVDLLEIVVYEAKRAEALEDAGFQDMTPSVECLFDYVLDAIGVPPEGAEFSREPFEEVFYNDYLLEHAHPSLSAVLDALVELRGRLVGPLASTSDPTPELRVVSQPRRNGEPE